MADWFVKVGNSTLTLWDGRQKFLSFESSSRGVTALCHKIKAMDRLCMISVVPKLSNFLATKLSESRVEVREIRISDIPIKPAYLKNIGVDRLMNIFSAATLTQRNLVVVDLGTALTADFFSKKRRHLGGWIFIGPDLALRTLRGATAKLPCLTPRSISKKFGKSTAESIQIGQAAYLRGMILEAKSVAIETFGSDFEIFITGGGARLAPKNLAKRVDHLALRGIKKLVQIKNLWRGHNFKN